MDAISQTAKATENMESTVAVIFITLVFLVVVGFILVKYLSKQSEVVQKTITTQSALFAEALKSQREISERLAVTGQQSVDRLGEAVDRNTAATVSLTENLRQPH